MTNNKNKVGEDAAAVANIPSGKVDTTSGEVLTEPNAKGEEAKENQVKEEATKPEDSNKEGTKKEEAKRIMSESEAREYIKSLNFKHIDIPELYETMQVPSYSSYEFRMAAYIIMWARKNNIAYKFDKKGNVYLTKGELAEGEFYPCVTAHMDSVQDKAKPYALAGAELPLRTRRVVNEVNKETRHEIYVDGQGIGADDKLGVYISLQLMEKFDKIKAAFFVEEEVGMKGSKELDPSFFDDVAYVLGWDSPDLHRAAWKCSGTRLFTYDFYTKHLAPVVKRWGFTDKCFHSEPFTDVINIREKTGVMCMNFGNGGYQAHSQTEYLVIEHVDHAVGMGADIISSIGNKEQFKTKKATGYSTYGSATDDDDKKLGKLFGEYVSTYTGSHSTTGSGTTGNNVSVRSDGKAETTPNTNDNAVDEEAVKYIVETYEGYISDLKEQVTEKANIIEDFIKDKFREAGIDFATFDMNIKDELCGVFSKEIKF